MRLRAGLIAWALLAAASTAFAVDPTHFDDPKLEARYLLLTHEFRCMQCQNESIADSPVDLAADLRRAVKEQLLAGKSDDDIRDFMVARYGEFILFRPRFSPRNAWLWFGPGVLLVVGVVVAARILRTRKALLAADTAPVEEDAAN